MFSYENQGNTVPSQGVPAAGPTLHSLEQEQTPNHPLTRTDPTMMQNLITSHSVKPEEAPVQAVPGAPKATGNSQPGHTSKGPHFEVSHPQQYFRTSDVGFGASALNYFFQTLLKRI